MLVRGYMPSEVPCARQVVTYTSLFVLYLMLRLLFIGFAVRTVAIESALFLVCGYELLLGVWQFCGGGYNSASVAIKGNFSIQDLIQLLSPLEWRWLSFG